MKITKVEIPVRDLIAGFENDPDTGRVRGYSGNLDIRPAYQREFVYNEKQRNAVIETIQNGFPLNTIYWAVRDDGTFEVLDGQQRIISICDYAAEHGERYAINYRAFHNLLPDEKAKILDYNLDVYQCEGKPSEKLEWFRIINTYGEKLNDQELLNAAYFGTWLSDAKKQFSWNNCKAYRLAKDYMSGSPIRQDYLATVLGWIASRDNTTLEGYMGQHQHDPNATELWLYFSSVIEWVKAVFPKYRSEMKGVSWGLLYNEFGSQYPDADKLEKQIAELMVDDDVSNKKGIYDYVLSGREKSLNIRAFSPKMKREAYERQGGICPWCESEGVHKVWELKEMEADHITPWHDGGHTSADNCQMLCKMHNRTKSGK